MKLYCTDLVKRYGKRTVVKSVSIEVEQGEIVGLLGPNGAGKTTTFYMIVGIIKPYSGRVFLDDLEITKMPMYRRAQLGVGYLAQEASVFRQMTVEDNIRYGNMEATDEQVIAAAKTVCAHDFIMQMENGYDTEVNERGTRLSAGQRQLISFARALLADPKILILDEATSSIDTETELLLQRGLNKLLKGRTSFIIAHRLSTIKNCGTIFYVDHGKIIEAGAHYELMAKQGEYYKLYSSQFALL